MFFFSLCSVLRAIDLPRTNLKVLLQAVHVSANQSPRKQTKKRKQFTSKTYLWEERGNHSSVSKLPARQRPQCLGSRLVRIIFDVNLADARRLFAAAARTGDLDLQDSAELLALILYILEDLCCFTKCQSWVPFLSIKDMGLPS